VKLPLGFKRLKEEHRPQLLDSRVLRKIFELKSGDVIVDWRKLHNDGLHDMCLWQDIIRRSGHEIQEDQMGLGT
jgi:hypothetical protein